MQAGCTPAAAAAPAHNCLRAKTAAAAASLDGGTAAGNPPSLMEALLGALTMYRIILVLSEPMPAVCSNSRLMAGVAGDLAAGECRNVSCCTQVAQSAVVLLQAAGDICHTHC